VQVLGTWHFEITRNRLHGTKLPSTDSIGHLFNTNSPSKIASWERARGIPINIRWIFRPNFLPWATKGGLAIADQSFFAGAHLLLNVLLARWFTSAEYGTFALAYSVFVLFASLHSALLVEPMLVFGAGRYSKRLDEYLGILIRGHFVLMLPVTLCTVAAAILIGRWSSTSVAHAFLALAFAIPFILILWLIRRAFYVELRPGWATLGGLLYLIVLLPLMLAMRMINRLSTVTALGLMSVGAVFVSVFLLLRLRPQLISRSDGVESKDVAAAHWQYGRWSVAAAAAGWIPLNIYYLFLPAWFRLEQAAALRALMNLIYPVLHVLIALGSLLIPTLVRNRWKGGKESMNRTMIISLTIFLSGSGLFSCALWVFRAQAFQLLYNNRYQQFGSRPLFFLLLSLSGTCIVAVLGAGLMALERPDGNFWSFIGSSIVTISVGLPLAAFRGVQGAAEGLLLSGFAAAACMYFLYRRAQCGQSSVKIGLSENDLSIAQQQPTVS